jgi:hypothetical protein
MRFDPPAESVKDWRAMVAAYLEAIDFTESDNEEFSDDVMGFAHDVEVEAARDCSDFLDLVQEAGLDVSDIAPDMMGHDLWLTRNRHGAGFWDRGYGPLGDELTKMAHSFGEQSTYEGDDHLIYLG